MAEPAGLRAAKTRLDLDCHIVGGEAQRVIPGAERRHGARQRCRVQAHRRDCGSARAAKHTLPRALDQKRVHGSSQTHRYGCRGAFEYRARRDGLESRQVPEDKCRASDNAADAAARLYKLD